MAFVLTAAQMQRADRWAIDTLGVPGAVLMENAGRGVVRLILRKLAARGQGIQDARISVVCGAGQNGGDGFVVARHICLSGASVQVLLAFPRSKLTGDALVNMRVADGMQIPVVDASSATRTAEWAELLSKSQITVDALFGTGLRSDVLGVPAAAIAGLNQHRAQTGAVCVAIDLPSGLDADTGQVRGSMVHADFTATVGARKLGLVLDPALPVGEIELMRLGVPLHTPAAGGPYAHFPTVEHVRGLLPRLASSAHKGTRGHVLIIAGSAGKTGAALLSAESALRGGAGLVTVASTAAGQVALDAKAIEAMTFVYTAGDDADVDSYARLAALSTRMKAAAAGPGIPSGPGTRALLHRLAAELPLPLVLDADGLNHLGVDFARLLRAAPAPRILTPHPGEAAGLLGCTTGEVQADRLGAARRLAADSGAVAILKGSRTLIAEPDGTVHVNPHADPSLATAGSGDVLTGLVAALLAQGLSPRDAAVAGVFAHGAGAEEACARLQTKNLIAGDLPGAIARWLSPLP